MTQRFVDIYPLLVVAGFLIIFVLVLRYLYRREEISLKNMGFTPLESVDQELYELTKTYLDREPSFVYFQHLWSPREPYSRYYMKLESTGDEAHPKCMAVRMETAFHKRIIIHKFYGSRRLFRVVKKLFFRFEYSHLKKVPLIELTELNEQYLHQYNLFAFGDEDFNFQDPFSQRLIRLLANIELKGAFSVGLLGRYLLIVSDSRRLVMNLWERLKPLLGEEIKSTR